MPTPEILPRLKISFGTSYGGKLSEFLEKKIRCGWLRDWGCEPILFELSGCG
jgi:hypothetical protein